MVQFWDVYICVKYWGSDIFFFSPNENIVCPFISNSSLTLVEMIKLPYHHKVSVCNFEGNFGYFSEGQGPISYNWTSYVLIWEML